jgi:hypothetical protein
MPETGLQLSAAEAGTLELALYMLTGKDPLHNTKQNQQLAWKLRDYIIALKKQANSTT